MKASPMANSAGFTLTELMVAVAVLGILASAGIPSFSKMIRNAEIRSAAESVSAGIQRARAEAVSRNARVQFVLSGGTSWYVDYVSTPNPAARLDSRASSDSVHASLTVLPVAATTITFNQLGQIVNPNPDASVPLTQITVTGTGGNQTLLVKIGVGGNSKVCDPGLPAANIRSCSNTYSSV